VQGVFPEITQISDTGLQRKVVEVWIRVLKRSKYRRIEDATVYPSSGFPGKDDNYPDLARIKLVDHTLAVVRGAICLAKLAKKMHNIEVDMDTLIAAGIIHDADKMLQYWKKGDKFVKSELAVNHGVDAARIAKEVGIPNKITEIVRAHSPRVGEVDRSKESILLDHADLAFADLYRSTVALELYIERFKDKAKQ